jgi:hypothetical protein
MMQEVRDWGAGEWLLIALGGAAGLLWALVSIVVGIGWWSSATQPWWADALRAMLLWPLFAAFYTPLRGVDVFLLALGIGMATGALGGLLMVLRLRR